MALATHINPHSMFRIPPSQIPITPGEPMQKLIVLYTQPDDVQAFETAYAAHVQLVANLPGLADTRISRFSRTLQGDGYYLMAEMLFPDAATLKSALRSAEMAAVGQDAQQFSNLKTMMLGEE